MAKPLKCPPCSLQHADSFKAIMSNAKAGIKTKTLALQLLPKYLGRYPQLADNALDILIDLFEEGEQVSSCNTHSHTHRAPLLHIHFCTTIVSLAGRKCGALPAKRPGPEGWQDFDDGRYPQYRMKAIEGFKMIAQTSTDAAVISKLVGVLSQLLLSQDEKEVVVVNASLCSALERNVQATCTTLLEMMGAEENVRIKAVQFLTEELCPRAQKLLNHSDEGQNAVANHIKKRMAAATAAEFKMFMKILFSLKIFQNGAEGATELLNIVTNTIDISGEFTAVGDSVDRVILMMGSAARMFMHGAQPNKLMSFISKKVFPKYDELSATQQLTLLKVVADMSPYMRGHCCREFLPAIYPVMMALLPDSATAETKINYTAAEAALYAFHQTASRVPGFLHSLCGIKINTGQPECKIDEDFTAKLADLHKRLTVRPPPLFPRLHELALELWLSHRHHRHVLFCSSGKENGDCRPSGIVRKREREGFRHGNIDR